ncbi:golgin subfamily A member 6-like protein 22 [Nilaparvata lugens]|uniref:golgin subfamily A member 6-like protein 22 n=1 Tax=Nilaparvata lugens TaxID=108931 RepID=UPI00193C9653|nr:golgin subfamily A member 6-like protein 22 [Nilaparvata lugens]
MATNESSTTNFESSEGSIDNTIETSESQEQYSPEMLPNSDMVNQPGDSHDDQEQNPSGKRSEAGLSGNEMDKIFNLLTSMREDMGASFEENSKKLEENKKEMNEKLEKLSSNVEQLERRFEKKMEEKTKEICGEIAIKITAVEKNVERIDKRLSTEIASVRKELSEKSGGMDNAAFKRFEEQLAEFYREKERMRTEFEKARTQPIIVNTSCRGSDEVPKFEKYLENPMQFLIKLKEYLRRSGKINWSEQSSIIEKSFDSQHSAWWMIIQASIDSLEQFEERFTNKFWSQLTQDSVRERLRTGKFIRGRKLNASEYFIKQMLIARNLTPALSDEEIIIKLVKHYGTGLETARFNRNVKTVPEMEKLLEEWSLQNIDVEKNELREKREQKEKNVWVQREERKSPQMKRREQEIGNGQQRRDNNLTFNGHKEREGFIRDGKWNSDQNANWQNTNSSPNVNWRRRDANQPRSQQSPAGEKEEKQCQRFEERNPQIKRTGYGDDNFGSRGAINHDNYSQRSNADDNGNTFQRNKNWKRGQNDYRERGSFSDDNWRRGEQ